MTKMAEMPIHDKILQNLLQNQKAHYLGALYEALELCGLDDQDGGNAHTRQNTSKSSSEPESPLPWGTVCSIGVVWSTKVVEMMIPGDPVIQSQDQSQICLLPYLNGKSFEKLDD